MVLEEERRREGIDSMILEMVTGPPEQVAPCIRNALERGWEQALPGSLAEFQQRRQEEIERVCSRYYAEFLGSVQELLTAKSRSAALRQQIVRFNEELKHTGQETLKTGYELQRHKAARRNINAAAVVLSQCRELTSLMATAKQQIEDARYYPALRTLDSIAHQLSVAYEQPFVHRVQRWLPELANQIKAAALRDVAQWLVVIRARSVSIGKGALRKCVNYMTGQGSAAGGLGGAAGAEAGAAGTAAGAAAAAAAAAAAPTPAQLLLQQVRGVINYTAWVEEEQLLGALPAFLRTPEGEDNQAFNSLAENLDPLHRALHIHAHLGALDEVAQYYVNNRLPQAALPTATATAGSAEEWVAQFQEALAYFAGFFVTEHMALQATEHPEGLLPAAKLEEAWWGIQRDLCRQMEARAPQLLALAAGKGGKGGAGPQQFLQVKQTALLLAFTLGEDCFRFNTQPLVDAVRGLWREGYAAAQLASLEATCARVLEHDVYQPLSVQSEKEYRMLVLPYGLDRHHHEAGLSAGEPLLVEEALFEPPTPSLPGAHHHPSSRRRGAGGGAGAGAGGGGGGGVGGTRYPRTFAFSAVVPKLSLELHRMVVLCCLYGLHLQLPAMEATVLKLTEDGLATVNRMLNKELAAGGEEDANFPISKACQISVDAVTLAKMTTDFEKMLQHAAARFYSTEAASRGVPEIVQRGKRELENTSIAAQHLVFELIQRKIDELLGGMCFIEWEAAAPQARPRSYAEDVVSYLQVTFMCLTYLPKMAREGIHFASCSHINAVMLDTLVDARKVRAVNTNGLYNLSLDLAALEAFADSCDVLQLRECFAELRQTLGALLHRDIHTLMLDAGLREGVYPKAQAAKLVAILEKYKPLTLLNQVRQQARSANGSAGDGAGGQQPPADLPYLDKKRVAEYIKALKHQMG